MTFTPLGRVGKIIGKGFRWMRKACNCFVAGTLVETEAGAVPIEELEVDDEVLTAPETSPTDPPRVGRVTRVFRNVAAAIVWLHLANGQVPGTTPGHEVWTLDDGWTYAAYLEAGDLFIGVDGDLVEIERIVVDPTPTVVYNLEVDGTFTYFAEGVLVHNDSCARLLKAAARSGLDFERYVRRILGSRGSFRVAGREFDGRIGKLWYEVKSSPAAGWSNWHRLKNQLGSQAAIARQNGRSFALFTPDAIPSGFSSWLARKGITHRIMP